MIKYIQAIIRENALFDCCYVEPFAGGAGVALSLLFDEYVSEILINDIDMSVYAFWYSVLNETSALCQMISETEVTMKNWFKQKEVQDNLTDCSFLELGFSTFFLNRTNRSGIIKGGVIGGKDQDGKWKIDARYNQEDLIRRIQRVARYKSKISLSNSDASDFILNVIPKLEKKTLVYLDPPYYNKAGQLYNSFYSHSDHKKISELVSGIRHPWIVSYDSVSEIHDLYRKFQSVEYTLAYSASQRVRGREVMFFSPILCSPNIAQDSIGAIRLLTAT